MRNFLRSLRYLWPYRRSLIAAVVCVLFVAILWGGGMASVLPGMKILLSEEGLHGWAYNSLTQDRLGARVVQRTVPPDVDMPGEDVSIVLDVVTVAEDGPGAAAGLEAGTWLIGMGGTRLRGDVLARELSGLEADTQVTLTAISPQAKGDQRRREVNVRLAEADTTSTWLGKIAGMVPEPKDHVDRWKMLMALLVVALVINLLRDVFRFGQEYLVQRAVYKGLVDLRCENYSTLLCLPTTFFSEKGVTDAMSRFIQDSNELARGQVTLFGKTLVEPAKAIVSLAVAVMLSWKLTLLTFVAGPPTYFLVRKFSKIMKRASRRALESWSRMLGVLEETLTGIRVVKAYTMEGAERTRFREVNRQLLRQQKRMAKIDSATAPAVEALGILAGLATIALAGYLVLRGDMDVHVFITWMACLAAMFDPVRKLAHVVTRFQRAEAAAARVFYLQDQEQEKRVPNAPMLARHAETIEFRDVHFRYPSAAEDALREVNLTVRAGETVAIVGPNGCGKTTLVSLVPRLLDPTSGAVAIDGHDVAGVSIRSLRRQVGLVTQDSVLFHATIGENIAYGLRRPKHEAVLAAARQAFVDEFVRDLPDGYDTMVGEHGATLSGGQKQRISIARAILRDPAILIFDEATSQIDSDSERRIHQAMETFVKDRTTLMIAHRFATVLTADRIVVMDAGRILDVGTHQELVDRCELYHHLYRTQFLDSGGT